MALLLSNFTLADEPSTLETDKKSRATLQMHSDLHGRVDSIDARIGNCGLFVLCEFTADARTVSCFQRLEFVEYQSRHAQALRRRPGNRHQPPNQIVTETRQTARCV